MPKIAREEIHGALKLSAEEMTSTAKSFAPVDSGDLRNSIGYTFGEYKPENSNVRGVTGGGGKLNDPDLTVSVHAGDAKAYYAAFVEFGTVDTPAQKFFFPAYRLVKKRVKSRISRATSKAAKKVAASS
jgi:HK97 gp10 family phage protein